jgi:uncharacterized protein YbjT (DUF2867 family)
VNGAVLVTGATGTVGRHLVRELLAAGQDVRAGVRDPAGADLPPGAVPVRLDLTDPTTAGAALEPVDRLFLLRPPAISDVQTAFGPLVAAARARGMRQVVVLSVMGVNPLMPHWRMERMVRAAGLPYVALRPAYFAQNLLAAFGEDVRQRSELRLAAGRGRLSFVDARDVAAVAARALTDPDRRGRRSQRPLVLTGPQALGFADAAGLLSEELGRTVRYRPESLRERRRELRERGLDPTYIRVQLVIDITTRLGLASRVSADVLETLHRPARTLACFVHDHRAAWLSPRTAA